MTLDPTRHPDWEIAQDAESRMKPFEALAEDLGLEPSEMQPFGRYMGKIEQQAVLRRLENRPDCKYVDVIVSSVDRMPADSINHLARTKFEGIDVWAPKDLKGYLKNHYPKLKSPEMLESLWVNHAPYKISFSENKET